MENNPEIKLPSNTTFGFFFFLIFLFLSLLLFFNDFIVIAIFCLFLSLILLGMTIISPDLLTTLNFFWFKLGLILGKIISPLILGIIFFLLITPIAFITRCFGRDELRLKKRFCDSYWISRTPPGPKSDSFNNQF